MKNLTSFTEKFLINKRFVFLNRPSESAPPAQTATVENLSVKDFDETILTNQQALVRAEELIQKVQKTPKLKVLTREEFMKLIQEAEAQAGKPENNNQKIGLGELAVFEANLEKLLEPGGQADYGGFEAREEGQDWADSLPKRVKDMMKESPTGQFKDIPGEKFLSLTREERVATFVEKNGDKYKADFHGNDSAFRAIGLGDLLPDANCLYVEKNGVVGKLTVSSIYGTAKIGYEDAQGNYMGIDTGDTFKLNVSEDAIQKYETKYETTLKARGITYERPDADKIKSVQDEFKEKFPEIDYGMQEDTSWEAVEYSGEIPTEHMNEAARLIAKEEGFRGTAYYDVNGYAIGYGTHKVERNGQLVPVTSSMTITKEDALKLLPRTIERHVSILRKRIDVKTITPKQFAALASLAYNYGPGFFLRTEVVRLLMH